MSATHDHDHTSKGVSLAKGPAWIVGSVLAVFGLIFFTKAPGTPLSLDGFANGQPTGPTFLGFEVNAWTAWLTTAAGVLVLIGVLQHLITKAMSLAVGIALAIAAGMALIDGDVLGLAAANGFTALGWGVAAALLIIAALLPRIGGDKHEDTRRDEDRRTGQDRSETRAATDRPRSIDPNRETDPARHTEPRTGRTTPSTATPAATPTDARGGSANGAGDGRPVIVPPAPTSER